MPQPTEILANIHCISHNLQYTFGADLAGKFASQLESCFTK